KYLAPGTSIESEAVKGSVDREIHNINVTNYAEKCKLGTHIAKLVFGITEELVMNAVYDAPVASGRDEYRNLPRTQPVHLKPDEYANLSYACDSQVFAISIADPFGMLEQQKLYQ